MCSSLLVGSLVLLGMLFSPELVNLMAPDFGLVPGKLGLTTLMTRIMFPFLLLVSLAALAMGMLNSQGKFFLPSLASSFFNLGSVVAGVTLSWAVPSLGLHPIVGMAWGALIGGLLQFLVQLPLLWREGFRPQWVLDWRDEGAAAHRQADAARGGGTLRHPDQHLHQHLLRRELRRGQRLLAQLRLPPLSSAHGPLRGGPDGGHHAGGLPACRPK